MLPILPILNKRLGKKAEELATEGSRSKATKIGPSRGRSRATEIRPRISRSISHGLTRNYTESKHIHLSEPEA